MEMVINKKTRFVNGNAGRQTVNLVEKIVACIEKSDFWTEKSYIKGRTISNLQCPECGDRTAWAYADKPFAIICNKLNHCGAKTKTLSLFPDILRNIESEHPPTADDPHYPATFYLHTRGLNKSLSGLRYEYWQDIRNTGSGGVMFQIKKSGKEQTYNGRLFNPPDNEGKTHNVGSTSGVFWQHPGMEYNMSSATYVTEGIIDALSLIEIGKQAIAVLSAGNTSSSTDLSEFEYLIFAFDNDPAGRKATQEWKEAYTNADAILPDIGDWNDFLLRYGHDAPKEFDSQTATFKKLCEAEALKEKIEEDKYDAEIFKHIRALNKKHAVTMLSGKCVIFSEVIEPTFNREDIAFSSFNDFRNYYLPNKVFNPKTKKQTNIATLWLNDKRRRQYAGIAFNPGTDIPGYYNLWRGFRIKPKQGDWDLMKRHIGEVICSGNKDHFTWLMAWFARLFQDPGGERGAAVVLQGKQGTGKGCLVNQFENFLGSHFLHVASQKQLTGNFNNHLKNALMVFCDEGYWAGSKSDEGMLKALITEPSFQIEPKGKDSFPVKNFVNLIIASNNKWVIPAGLEERRFFVLQVGEQHIQDTGYFKKIWDQMNNGGREAMLYDLLNLDMSDIDLRRAPKTEALAEQIQSSSDLIEKWWFGCLHKGEIINGADQWEESLLPKQIYDEYIAFCKATEPNKKRLADVPFYKEFKSLCSGIYKERDSVSGTDGKRPERYRIPSLEDCRAAMDKKAGYSFKWGY